MKRLEKLLVELENEFDIKSKITPSTPEEYMTIFDRKVHLATQITFLKDVVYDNLSIEKTHEMLKQQIMCIVSELSCNNSLENIFDLIRLGALSCLSDLPVFKKTWGEYV